MERNAFLSGCVSPAQRSAMDFLFTHLPQSDLDSYDASLFLAFADHALALREEAPWCAALDEEIFYHYVLFPRVNDEDLSFHREIFRAALWERLAPLSTVEEKALEVNRWCCEMASYEMQDDRTASPLTVYRSGSGRCGEESAFAVAALRSVGIPARQVYSPRWAHCDDNHAWVEVLCGGEWKFFGACEPEPILNRGWFNTPASRALLVHSRLFGGGAHQLHGEQISRENCIRWYNQTARYALTRRYRFHTEVDGIPAAGAVIHIQVMNEASFHTIATLTADANGEAAVELGIGDFHVVACLGDRWAECDVHSEESVTLQLTAPSCGDTDWHTADYFAPVDTPVNPAPLTAEQKKMRKTTLAVCAAIRERRRQTADTGEIAAFLAADGDPLRSKLVETLTEKDRRDVTAEILNAHLNACVPQGDLPDAIFERYVLCPRVELEPLTAWREPLAKVLSEHTVHTPEEVFSLLDRHLMICEENVYGNLVTPPEKAWRARGCSKRSAEILTVAMLRTMGIPARLRESDGVPEYFASGVWRTAAEEARVVLTVRGEGAAYRRDWTLSRREEQGWKLLREADTDRELVLPEGQYRLQTSVRLPNGNQLAAWREISLADGEHKETELLLREYALSDMLCSRRLMQMSAATLAGKRVADICRMGGRTSLLLWPEEGGEPTEHILLELAAESDAFRALELQPVFLLRSRDSLRNATLADTAKQLDAVCLLPEDWEFDLEQTARHLTCDPDTPPLAVVCDREGNAVYGDSGYRVGAVELLRRVAEYTENRR